MSFDNAYEAVTEVNDARWAFGTGFEDPLAGVDTTLPAGADGGKLATYCLMLGDDALIMSHRLQEWCTNAPELEEEVAIANIALDLLGQTRLLYARAGKADGSGRGEDDYAYFRGERDFYNVRLTEVKSADFAELIAQLLFFSTWRLAILERLQNSADPVLSAIAAKGVKEVTYHRDYAAQWAVRLGDGTAVSHTKMQNALSVIWPYVAELFEPTATETGLASVGVAVDPRDTEFEFHAVLAQVLRAATLAQPEEPALSGVAGMKGRDGMHTEAMGYLLAELQSVARAFPGATW